jgi:hypothetical protein
MKKKGFYALQDACPLIVLADFLFFSMIFMIISDLVDKARENQ